MVRRFGDRRAAVGSATLATLFFVTLLLVAGCGRQPARTEAAPAHSPSPVAQVETAAACCDSATLASCCPDSAGAGCGDCVSPVAPAETAANKAAPTQCTT